jgi:hypothetical protein
MMWKSSTENYISMKGFYNASAVKVDSGRDRPYYSRWSRSDQRVERTCC